MCGFTSYIDDTPAISEVIAIDFCREALELYARPERQRVLFDLSTVSEAQGMEFIPNQALDTIVISFGVDYLDDPTTLYHEFYRILSPGGRFLIVGGRACGYAELIKRYFQPGFHIPLLEQAGFEVMVQPLPYGGQGDEAEYHLIEAVKPLAYQGSLF